MPERGIAQVVRQAPRAHDGADFLEQFRILQFHLLPAEELADLVSQRTSDAGNLQAVRKAVVDEDVARQGEYLRLVLQPAEG